MLSKPCGVLLSADILLPCPLLFSKYQPLATASARMMMTSRMLSTTSATKPREDFSARERRCCQSQTPLGRAGLSCGQNASTLGGAGFTFPHYTVPKAACIQPLQLEGLVARGNPPCHTKLSHTSTLPSCRGEGQIPFSEAGSSCVQAVCAPCALGACGGHNPKEHKILLFGAASHLSPVCPGWNHSLQWYCTQYHLVPRSPPLAISAW